MFATRMKCKVLETRWATPSVFLLRFEPSKAFTYLPGQFVSVVIPTNAGPVKRCYSLASSPEESRRHGHYELCVRLAPGGVGSTFLSRLKPGDRFNAVAPFGLFTYKPAEPGRGVVFVCSSTGIAPFRSIVASAAFQRNAPARSLILYGARDEREILYERDFRQLGIETVHAISRPTADWKGFKGRVTDYLSALTPEFPWHTTDFYLCGNGEMIRDVNDLLLGGRGVAQRSIHLENFSPARPAKVTSAAETEPKLVPAPMSLKTAA
jgi:ferredoxin-NADP reductase